MRSRPADVITAAAGVTVEVRKPDAEGRLILADALWYARVEGATHLVDLATPTGAMRGAMGDIYGGVFADDDACRRRRRRRQRRRRGLRGPGRCTDGTGACSTPRSPTVRNTSGKPFGYPITAATFLERFAGDGPWAHVDMIGPALFDDDRGDAIGRGASGYGVRMLVELARRLADTPMDRGRKEADPQNPGGTLRSKA
jgi:leucyl aminopeptidase